jgi:ATP-dependent helicase/nuclease subunit A
MSLTAAQQKAIQARGNVVLSAGAGTGKTRTLVERCLGCLLSESQPASISEMLLVTFTEAAAAEMRHRIRDRLDEELARKPGDDRLLEQLALFEQANIGTLHGFCFKLVRQHFHELQLDPQLAVMPQEEARLVAGETLEEIFTEHYEGRAAESAAVRDLITSYGRDGDGAVRRLVLRLHEYSQTLPDPGGWLRDQQAFFDAAEPAAWEQWLKAKAGEWRDAWKETLGSGAHDNQVGQACLQVLRRLPQDPSREDLGPVLRDLETACLGCPRGKKALWLDPLKEFRADIDFMKSLIPGNDGDPLVDDWGWVRGRMRSLLGLCVLFGRRFSEAKREAGLVDFHDLEQHALTLLWDRASGQPTAVAEHWRRQLRYVFVDEYQDINAAQDKIISMLSREGAEANRFLVGDVKQSIYRFRLANPRIFQGYMQNWSQGAKPDPAALGHSLPLVENFRTRERLLGFVNSVFELIMRPEAGGIAYDESARLVFGAPEARIQLGAAAIPDPCAEIHLRLKSRGAGHEEDAAALELADLEEASKEARLVGLRLKQLKEESFSVFDEGTFRPMRWSDAAILLRSPRVKAENYAQEFARLGIPLAISRASFYEGQEIRDFVCLLECLDNPVQDAALVAVLRSPFGGLTLEELGSVRLAAKGFFWFAVNRFFQTRKADGPGLSQPVAVGGETPPKLAGEDACATGERRKTGQAALSMREPSKMSAQAAGAGGRKRRSQPHPAQLELGFGIEPQAVTAAVPSGSEVAAGAGQPVEGASGAGAKLALFLDRHARWRRLARQGSLSKCLETILAETQYDRWLLSQPRGSQRRMNVERLLGLARQFDHFQRQGLFRFLRFLEAQKEADASPDAPESVGGDAVRLMSIHQSKGLEFPIVALGDFGKPFNTSDLKQPIILDDRYGLCPLVRPPGAAAQYPSVAHWLARGRQHAELLGDELRLLYVAMTRARDRLILAGTVSKSKLEKFSEADLDVSGKLLARAQSYADWLGLWFGRNVGATMEDAKRGKTEHILWWLYEDTDLLLEVEPEASSEPVPVSSQEVDWAGMLSRVQWTYPHAGATSEPAKASVSGLKKRAMLEMDDEVAYPARLQPPFATHPARGEKTGLSAVEIGTAHHVFLEHLDLKLEPSLAAYKRELARMVQAGFLDPESAKEVRLERVLQFWNSEVGGLIRSHQAEVRRELSFTARFYPGELVELFGIQTLHEDKDVVVLQGTADLVVIRPGELWLLDFKTDQIGREDLEERATFYRGQLGLYARALEAIHQKPVTHRWLHFLALGQTLDI